jgi:putative DNA primase/helicase
MNMIEPAALLAKPPRGKKKLSGIGDNELITEDAAALAFARAHEGKLKFFVDDGKWYEWTGTVWRQNRTGIAFRWARDLVRELVATEDDRVRAIAGKMSFAAGVERGARTDEAFAVTADYWDKDPFLLATPTGTVDLRTGVLRPSDPNDGITKSTSVSPADTATCPQWLKFLREATGGDAELIRFLQQWAGYCLTGDTREQSFVFVYGLGGNGKGVYLRAIAKILGEYHRPAPIETFTASAVDHHPTDLAGLRGARLVTATETEEGRQWAESRIKQLTGGDMVSARFMRQDFFDYEPQYKIIITGNHKPSLKTVDEAIGRRINIIPFNYKPETPDLNLDEKLKSEWPQILRWMIEGCLDWTANGLTRPAVVKAATREYLGDQNLFAQWLEEECESDPTNHYLIEKTATLFQSWAAYAKAAGTWTGSKIEFNEKLSATGFKKDKGTAGIRIWRGVCLRKKEGRVWTD